LSVIVALFTSVGEGHRIAAWSAAASLYGGHFGARYLFGLDSPSWGQYIGVGAWLLVVLTVSEVARARRDWAVEAAQSREEESQRRRSDERLRIARELHDVLAHNISLINVQSGVALHLMDREPQQARTALTAIEAASREALTELRSVLDILRRPEDDVPRSPAPGLDRLDSLLDSARASGLEVEGLVSGDIRPLPVPTDAAVFRVIQEALTNVIRHASARRVTVRIHFGDEDLEIEVLDDGAASPTQAARPPAGNGIAGMRERVTALGGSFEAGPRASGGFRVSARLPMDRPS
jgi:signal transduction histidine kinase